MNGDDGIEQELTVLVALVHKRFEGLFDDRVADLREKNLTAGVDLIPRRPGAARVFIIHAPDSFYIETSFGVALESQEDASGAVDPSAWAMRTVCDIATYGVARVKVRPRWLGGTGSWVLTRFEQLEEYKAARALLDYASGW